MSPSVQFDYKNAIGFMGKHELQQMEEMVKSKRKSLFSKRKNIASIWNLLVLAQTIAFLLSNIIKVDCS